VQMVMMCRFGSELVSIAKNGFPASPEQRSNSTFLLKY